MGTDRDHGCTKCDTAGWMTRPEFWEHMRSVHGSKPEPLTGEDRQRLAAGHAMIADLRASVGIKG